MVVSPGDRQGGTGVTPVAEAGNGLILSIFPAKEAYRRAHAAAVETPPAPSVLGLVVKYGLFAAVGVLGVRFFTKDAVPYLIDVTVEQYGRLWDVRWWLIPHIAGGTTALARPAKASMPPPALRAGPFLGPSSWIHP